jgi:hypothetical protein
LTIDVEASLSIVDATHEFVDLFKVGRVNYLPFFSKLPRNFQNQISRTIDLGQHGSLDLL